MMEILIRPYEEKDWQRLNEIHDAARKIELHYARMDDAFLPLSIAAEREGLFEYFLAVAESGGCVQGFAAWTEDELAWLYVAPEAMRTGIGRKLAEHVLANTQRPVEVELLEGNLPALELYRSLGFGNEEIVHGVMPGNESFAVTVRRLHLD